MPQLIPWFEWRENFAHLDDRRVARVVNGADPDSPPHQKGPTNHIPHGPYPEALYVFLRGVIFSMY